MGYIITPTVGRASWLERRSGCLTSFCYVFHISDRQCAVSPLEKWAGLGLGLEEASHTTSLYGGEMVERRRLSSEVKTPDLQFGYPPRRTIPGFDSPLSRIVTYISGRTLRIHVSTRARTTDQRQQQLSSASTTTARGEPLR